MPSQEYMYLIHSRVDNSHSTFSAKDLDLLHYNLLVFFTHHVETSFSQKLRKLCKIDPGKPKLVIANETIFGLMVRDTLHFMIMITNKKDSCEHPVRCHKTDFYYQTKKAFVAQC